MDSRRAVQAQFAASTLTPSAGLISTVHDYAQFDLALRNGILLNEDTLISSWRPPVDGAGKLLPHAIGWFVQNYNGEPWYGSSARAETPAHRRWW